MLYTLQRWYLQPRFSAGRTALLLLAPALLSACCDNPNTPDSQSHADTNANDSNTAPTLQNNPIAGHYMATQSCNDCPSIATHLILKNDGQYEWLQHYQHPNAKTTVEEGQYHLSTPSQNNAPQSEPTFKSATLTLRAGQRTKVLTTGTSQRNGDTLHTLQVGLGDQASSNPSYTLYKAIEFNGTGQQLIVIPHSVKHLKMAQGHYEKVIFEGLVNNTAQATPEYRSLTAIYDIDCKANRYGMPLVQYHRLANSAGATASKAYEKGHQMELIEENTQNIVTQAAAFYCE